MTDFDPSSHQVVEMRPFEALKTGERFPIPSRTVGESSFAAFQTVSADNHPVHYDIEYCRRHGHRSLIAHGFQVLAFTAAGAGLFPHVAGEHLLGFIEQSSRFLKPVYLGDTLYPSLMITALERQRTTGVVTMASTVNNERGELVLERVVRRTLPAELGDL